MKSAYGDRLTGYLELKRSLGYELEEQAVHLRALDDYAFRRGLTEPLSQAQAVAFATEDPASSPHKRARRYQAVRGFCEYLSTFDPEVPRLDPKAVPRPDRPSLKHILTDEDLSRLLEQARHVSEFFPVRGVTLHAMIGLGASTGLRIGEVVRLDKADVDLETGTLLIRRTKFRKDRFVPTHASTLEELRRYAAARDSAFPDCRDPAFFITLKQQRFSKNTLQQTFCKVARRAGLRPPAGRGMSFHGLRHRFAVKRLVSWYQAGVDVQAMLPVLATFMGHVHYSETAYYLTATAELLQCAAERYYQALSERGGGA